MFKKIVTGAVTAGLLAISTAGAAQVEPENSDRRAGNAVGGPSNGISTPLLVGIFAAFSAGLILLIEENEDNDASPVSP